MTDRFRVSRMLARDLRAQNISVAAVLRRAGLPEGFLQQEKIFASTEELFALWRAIGETSGDPAIGLKLGGDACIEGGTPQAIAALSSVSFTDAVQRMARYKKLCCPEEIRLRPGRDESAVELVFTLGNHQEPPALVDLCLSWMLAIGRRGTGVRIVPLRVELMRPEAQRRVLEDYFACPVKFGADRNALVLRPADLERAFVTHSPELLAMLGPQLDAELHAQAAERNINDQVKAALGRLLSGRRASITDVARALGMSTRTLQRRLTESGVTFQQLLQEARRGLAHHYLAQSRMELSETAYLLGFDDANSFFRAFHRWEGTSPLRWRKDRQQAAGEGAQPAPGTTGIIAAENGSRLLRQPLASY